MLLAGIISRDACFLEKPDSSLGWEKPRATSADLSVPGGLTNRRESRAGPSFSQKMEETKILQLLLL